MKKFFITMMMLLSLTLTSQMAAQKHRHSARTTAVAPVTTQDTTGIEAFSDTTGIAEEDSLGTQQNVHYQVSMSSDFDRIMNEIDWGDVTGMIMIICVVAIMFLLSPILIIAVIFYFVNKGRKDKLKLAQMALQNGQPIPEPLIHERPTIYSRNAYRSGIKQVFLGLGLMIFLGLIIGKLGWGIGALVFFIGLGKIVIALVEKTSEKKTYTFTPRQTPPPTVDKENTTTTSNDKVEE